MSALSWSTPLHGPHDGHDFTPFKPAQGQTAGPSFQAIAAMLFSSTQLVRHELAGRLERVERRLDTVRQDTDNVQAKQARDSVDSRTDHGKLQQKLQDMEKAVLTALPGRIASLENAVKPVPMLEGRAKLHTALLALIDSERKEYVKRADVEEMLGAKPGESREREQVDARLASHSKTMEETTRMITKQEERHNLHIDLLEKQLHCLKEQLKHQKDQIECCLRDQQQQRKQEQQHAGEYSEKQQRENEQIEEEEREQEQLEAEKQAIEQLEAQKQTDQHHSAAVTPTVSTSESRPRPVPNTVEKKTRQRAPPKVDTSTLKRTRNAPKRFEPPAAREEGHDQPQPPATKRRRRGGLAIELRVLRADHDEREGIAPVDQDPRPRSKKRRRGDLSKELMNLLADGSFGDVPPPAEHNLAEIPELLRKFQSRYVARGSGSEARFVREFLSEARRSLPQNDFSRLEQALLHGGGDGPQSRTPFLRRKTGHLAVKEEATWRDVQVALWSMDDVREAIVRECAT